MNLIIKIPILKANSPINYSSKIVLLGSCFSDNIGEKLEYYKFQNLQNPLGILFHPKAIETLIVNAIEEKSYLERDLFFYNEQWHCFDAHSKLSNSSKEVLLSHLNQAIESTNQQISKSTHIIITLGTAWAYRFVENNHIVANCHKVPQKQFSKELLSVEEILQSLENMVSLIQKVNPDVAIIFTVSPVRHIKDGFVENNGIIEIKSQIQSVHIETIDTGKIDTSYYRQINWGLFITARNYCDFISWSPLVVDYPIWIKRFERDEKLIKDLNDGADKFIDELKSLVLKIKRLKELG